MKAGKLLEHEALTERIIKCAIEVHKRLGPGFLESIYENAFMIELQKENLQVERQREVTVKYDGVEVEKHRLDLIVDDTIVMVENSYRHLAEKSGEAELEMKTDRNQTIK